VRGKRLQGYGSSGGDSDDNGRKKRANGVNPNPGCSIYRGVHPIRPLRLLPSYDAHYNGYIPTISRENHTDLFARRETGDLSSEFRSSVTPLSSGHLVNRTSITTRSISLYVTLILVFDKSICQKRPSI
jgi:hypothetical protein